MSYFFKMAENKMKSNYLNYLGVKFLETLVLSATLMS